MAAKSRINLKKLRLLLLDVDGVLTDGSLQIYADGSESKVFNVYDGHRIRMWQRAGLMCGLLSGRQSEVTQRRAEQLEISLVLQDCKEKLPAFERLLAEIKLEPDEVAYVGDDLMDLPILRRVGFAVAVANAPQEVRRYADYVTVRDGGKGAVAEVIEYLLQITGRWEELLQRYQV
jgi:3-deoxy-D-manno-octulosonate 8-phosphate phosphatase (KDO 8-P phosphatase)